MSPVFSRRSTERLGELDLHLAEVLDETIKYFDFSIICGHRGETEQNAAFQSGVSQRKWPEGKHNKVPSEAVDVAPYPIDWGDTERFTYLAGWIMAIAQLKGIKLRWGGDFNQNMDPGDERFKDLGHFEILDLLPRDMPRVESSIRRGLDV
jgi:peptidoglycan L-alanyl-D-glutamate endopeptidase CwlK